MYLEITTAEEIWNEIEAGSEVEFVRFSHYDKKPGSGVTVSSALSIKRLQEYISAISETHTVKAFKWVEPENEPENEPDEGGEVNE